MIHALKIASVPFIRIRHHSNVIASKMNGKRPYWSPKKPQSVGEKSGSSISKCSSLSVDVSKEMAAVSRDIDTVIRRGQACQGNNYARGVQSPVREVTRSTGLSPKRPQRSTENYICNPCEEGRQLTTLVVETKDMVNKVYKRMVATQQRACLLCRSCSFSRASCQSSCGRQTCCHGAVSRWRECRHPPGYFHDTSCILEIPPCPATCHKTKKEKGVNVSPSVHGGVETLATSHQSSSKTPGNPTLRDACCSPVREILTASEAEIENTVSQLKERIAAAVSAPQRRIESSSPLIHRQSATPSPVGRYCMPHQDDSFNDSFCSDELYEKKMVPAEQSPECGYSVTNRDECLRRGNFLPRPMPSDHPRTGGGDHSRRALVWEVLAGLICHKERNCEATGLVDDTLCLDVMKKLTQILLANIDPSERFSEEWKLQDQRRHHLNNILAELACIEELDPPLRGTGCNFIN